MKKIPFFIIFAACLFPACPDDEIPITEIWRETLLYGIDSEVLEVIKSIDYADEQALNQDLLDLLVESMNTSVRRAILQFFSRTKYREAESTALSLLADEEIGDSELIIALLRYLSALESGSASEILIPLLDHETQEVARAAITALSKSGDKRIGGLILEKLEDPDFPEQLIPDIILALGELQYQEAADALIDIAKNRDKERIRRMYACTALGKIGDKRAVPILRGLFTENDSLIKMYAVSALSCFDMKEVEDLLIQGLKDSNVKVRITSAKALAHKEAKKAVEILIYKAKKDPEKQVRVQAIKTLGEIGSREAYDFLKEQYGDSTLNPLYRETALAALVDNDLRTALPTIREVLEKERGNKNQKVLEFTAKKLSQANNSALKGLFVEFLESDNQVLRIYGIRGISKNQFGDLKGRIRSLSEEDPHPAVRRVALSALNKL